MVKPNIEADPRNLLNRAINLLSYRPRSVAEMRFRLGRICPDKTLVDRTIERLLQDKLLDDLEFAKWWVDQRLTFRPKGNRALTAELSAKGVDRQIINLVLPSREQEKQLAGKLRDKYSLSQLQSRGFPIDALGQTA